LPPICPPLPPQPWYSHPLRLGPSRTRIPRYRSGFARWRWDSGFLIPTGRTEPARSGTGLPVRFGRKPDKFKFQTKFSSANGWNRCTDRFNWYTRPVRPVPGCLNKKTELV
jgi:hypothetical protein